MAYVASHHQGLPATARTLATKGASVTTWTHKQGARVVSRNAGDNCACKNAVRTHLL